MSMGHRDNYNCVTVDAVNDCVRKVGEKTFANLRFNLRRSIRISFDESNGSIECVQEVQTPSFLSPLKPNDSIINFLSSEREESDVHLLLYLLINSS